MKAYITFGQAHIHKINGKLLDKDCIAVIERKTEQEIMDTIQEYFGITYCTYYIDDKWINEYIKYYPKGYIEL